MTTSLKQNIDLHALEKIYIEPTNTCNLRCKTCIRNVWDEQDSFITQDTFRNIIKSITEITPPPSVFFGGFGNH